MDNQRHSKSVYPLQTASQSAIVRIDPIKNGECPKRVVPDVWGSAGQLPLPIAMPLM